MELVPSAVTLPYIGLSAFSSSSRGRRRSARRAERRPQEEEKLLLLLITRHSKEGPLLYRVWVCSKTYYYTWEQPAQNQRGQQPIPGSPSYLFPIFDRP